MTTTVDYETVVDVLRKELARQADEIAHLRGRLERTTGDYATLTDLLAEALNGHGHGRTVQEWRDAAVNDAVEDGLVVRGDA